MRSLADVLGYKFGDCHHEIYVTNPSRVEFENLRTVLRLPLNDGAKRLRSGLRGARAGGASLMIGSLL